jgi:hypothetical protein
MATGIEEVISWLLTSKDLASLIWELLNQEDTLLKKIADAHRTSAKQAVSGARKVASMSSSYREHMSEARGHLRDCYNLLIAEAEKGPTFWNWLNEQYGYSSRTFRAMHAYEEAAEVAMMIHQLYKKLGELANARDWAANALRAFDKYAELASTQIATYQGRDQGGWTDRHQVMESDTLQKERRRLQAALV